MEKYNIPIGLWEKINNPDFKGVEFNLFRNELGLESLNAEFIKQGLFPEDRLERLNTIAIEQVKLLLGYKKKLVK